MAWKNQDGTKSLRYRVRIQRKDFKSDELFKDITEAQQFLLNSKTKSGRAMLQSKHEVMQAHEKELLEKWMETQLLKSFIRTFVYRYQRDVVETIDTSTESQKRKKSNLLSFLKTIRTTKIERVINAKVPSMMQNMTGDKKELKDFGSIEIEDFSEYDVNAYIVARLKEKKKSSTINRELSIISQIFEHCRHSTPALKGLMNPVQLRNKKLLSGKRDQKPKRRLTDQDKERLFLALDSYSNPELKTICLLSLATAMRRSEIVNLKWWQVGQGHIHLPTTKSNRPRDVYLTQEAQELLSALPRSADTSKVFGSYSTVAGFEGSFTKLMHTHSLEHITFHIFRKEAFSIFFERLGADNATLLSEFLGVSSVRKFKELHAPKVVKDLASEKNILQSGGHMNAQTTKDHYLTLKKEEQKLLTKEKV
ncbi:site-specific integrase [Acidovorax sp. NCPPB 3576]|uniref:site-specific integrase n=1 Tax=Acidovorax sp. NCPPB 3576 TaxID=2940488 RepID=UPI00234B5A9B|nr:tyrosine-type recombinase/integrase [Acidovorax sp. NCPPB 3576]WCM90653.1 site-specific integrase [Acidovorax sp. NCPPB 3576]